jgi:hypothetical protein
MGYEDSMNLYQSFGMNPINFTDPFGGRIICLAPFYHSTVKVKDRPLASQHYKHSQALGNIPVVQLTRENNILKKSEGLFFRISARRFFA